MKYRLDFDYIDEVGMKLIFFQVCLFIASEVNWKDIKYQQSVNCRLAVMICPLCLFTSIFCPNLQMQWFQLLVSYCCVFLHFNTMAPIELDSFLHQWCWHGFYASVHLAYITYSSGIGISIKLCLHITCSSS